MRFQQTQDLVNVCPKGVFDIEDLTGQVNVANPDECNGCRACVFWAQDNGLNLNTVAQNESCGEECPGPGREKRSKQWRVGGRCWDCGQELEDGWQNTVEFPKERLFEWHRFTVETNGSLEAADAVQRALFILQSRLVSKAEAAGAQPSEYPELK